MGVYPILGVLGAQPERMVWVMMRKMVDDGEVAKMHGFLRKHGVPGTSYTTHHDTVAAH